MSQAPPPLNDQLPPVDPGSRSRRNRIILGSVLVLVVALTAVQVLIQQLRFPTPIASNILIFALVNVNIVLLLLLVLLVFRSLFKVYLERRENLLGSKFRVKLAVAFVSLALLPAGLLFLVASNLITNSVDSWFNSQVEQSLDNASDVARAYARNTQDEALNQARQVAARLGDVLGPGGSVSAIRRLGTEKVREYGLDGLQIFSRKQVEVGQWRGSRVPGAAMLSPASPMVRQGLHGESFVTVQSFWQGDVIRAVAPVIAAGQPREVLGVVTVTTWIPDALATKAAEIEKGMQEYQQLRLLKNPIKGIYLMLFLMVTLVIIFGAIWVGVYLARGITVPIQQLAEGTRKVAAGDLSYRVQVKADDEIGMLVESFNRMTEDLGRGKVELTQAYQELQHSNVELDRRRAYMETVLETIASGVLSLDAGGRVNTVNSAAARMLGRPAGEILHRSYAEVFGEDTLAPLRRLVAQLAEEGRETSDQQITLTLNGRPATLMVTVGALRGPGGDPRGLLVVLDDISEVIRAQQALAWRHGFAAAGGGRHRRRSRHPDQYHGVELAEAQRGERSVVAHRVGGARGRQHHLWRGTRRKNGRGSEDYGDCHRLPRPDAGAARAHVERRRSARGFSSGSGAGQLAARRRAGAGAYASARAGAFYERGRRQGSGERGRRVLLCVRGAGRHHHDERAREPGEDGRGL